jgi:hypothetical protein
MDPRVTLSRDKIAFMGVGVNKREYFKLHFYLWYIYLTPLYWNDNACACDCQIILMQNFFHSCFRLSYRGRRKTFCDFFCRKSIKLIVDFSSIQDRKNYWWSTYADFRNRCLQSSSRFDRFRDDLSTSWRHVWVTIPLQISYLLFVANHVLCWWQAFQVGSGSIKMYTKCTTVYRMVVLSLEVMGCSQRNVCGSYCRCDFVLWKSIQN